jgi:AcrR family transcriptional regulator
MIRASRVTAEEPAPERRPYDSPVRRQRAAETRSRILRAGTALVRGFPSWDWRDLTFRSVAERAGVSERTVYRHFETEQELHRAVMRQLEHEAGITYEGLRLQELSDVTARVFAARMSFAAAAVVAEPPFVDEDRQRRRALLDAVSPLTGDWSDTERQMAAGMLDAIWAIPSYERLLVMWELAPDDATQAVIWVIGLVVQAIQDGRRPEPARAARNDRPRPSRSATKGSGGQIKN